MKLKKLNICKCKRKIHIDIINKEMKGSSSLEEEIGTRKCMIRGRFGTIKEKAKGWESSSKQQEATPEPTKNKKGYPFITDKNKGKNISPRMGLFCASGTVEILNVR